MMHDRKFLARLVDIDGVNMLVIFPRRRGCLRESSCIRSSCANAVVMLVIFF